MSGRCQVTGYPVNESLVVVIVLRNSFVDLLLHSISTIGSNRDCQELFFPLVLKKYLNL